MIPWTCEFDWYEFTFETVADDRSAKSLAIVLNATVSRVKGRNGYSVGESIERDGVVLATVFSRSARPGEVHVVITGGSARELVPVVRRLWPDHRVTRADAAMDFVGDFDELDARMLAFADSRGLSNRFISNSEGGKTRYLGSARSEFMVRGYKKTEEQRQKHPEAAQELPEGVIRVEATARPGKRDAKARVARMTAEQVWGLSAWGRDFAQQFLTVEVERVSTHFWRPPAWTRTLHYLGLQYGPGVAQRVDEVGLESAREEVLAALGLA